MDRQSVQSYVDQIKKADLEDGPEKRKHPRYNVSFNVYIKLSNGEIVNGLAKNISKGGICLEYDSSAEAGSEFELMFSLTIKEDIEKVYARGKVVRSVAVAGRNVFRIAFVFLALRHNSEQVLDRFLHKCHTQFPDGY